MDARTSAPAISEGAHGDAVLAPVRADSLGQQVFERIRDAIFNGSIRPGEPLRELQLAKSIGVSQSTVREALSQLETVGLVVRQANRGTTVTQLSAKETRERMKIRIALEELAVMEASQRATSEDIEELRNLAKAISAAIERNSYYDISQADLAFHRRIWNLSDSPVLERTLNAITLPLFAFLGVLQKMESVSLGTSQPHDELVSAIATRDPETTRLAIRKHILQSYPSILNAAAAPRP